MFARVSRGKRAFLRALASVISARHDAPEAGELLRWLAPEGPLDQPEWKIAALQGMEEGLSLRKGRRLSSPGIAASLERLLGDDSEHVRAAAAEVAPYVDIGARVRQAIAAAMDERLPIARRVLSVRVLQGGAFRAVAPALETMIRGGGSSDLRTAAAESLASFDHPSVAKALIGAWDGYPSSTRDAVAEMLIRRRDRALAFAEAIVAGSIDPMQIPAITRIRLANHPDEAVRARLDGLLGLGAGDRDRAIDEHLRVLDLVADAARGRAAFDRECANCHLRRSERGRIGPDLSGVNNRSTETLLTSILDPSHSIEDRYRNHLLETTDGRFYDGILVAETEASVTLRGESEDVTVLKEDIADLRASAVSLMPDGLEDALTDQEIADVIAYLRAGL